MFGASEQYNIFIWMPLMGVEFVTMCFTLRRTYLVYRRSYGAKIVMSSLLEVVIRDNILYFVMCVRKETIPRARLLILIYSVLLLYAAGIALMWTPSAGVSPRLNEIPACL